MTDRLDQNRPYATIHGGGANRARFEQDGKLYDNQKVLLKERELSTPVKPPVTRAEDYVDFSMDELINLLLAKAPHQYKARKNCPKTRDEAIAKLMELEGE